MTWRVTIWLCAGALGYCCCITRGAQLALEAGCALLLAGYASWLTYYR